MTDDDNVIIQKYGLSAKPERTDESQTFLGAFRNNDAREFLHNLQIHTYTHATLLHHPGDRLLSEQAINEKCTHLVDTIFSVMAKLQNKPEYLFSLFEKFSRNAPQPNDIWFTEFIGAYNNYKHHSKLENRYRQLKKYIRGTGICDIGCGGGDLVHFFKLKNRKFDTAGIDIVDWRTPEIKDQIDYHVLDFTIPGVKSPKQYTTAFLLAVLHHAGKTDAETDTFLRGVSSAITDAGTLIVEEDVIIRPEDYSGNNLLKKQIENNKAHQPFFEKFVSLNEKTQKDFIILGDFLANTLSVGVPEMPFPCGFRAIGDWKAVFNRNGFGIDHIEIIGFKPGNFNQTSHALFILKKEQG